MDRNTLIARRDDLLSRAGAIVDEASDGMTAEQLDEVRDLRSQADHVTAQITELDALAEQRNAAAETAATIDAPATTVRAEVTSEPRTYRPDNTLQRSFFADAFRAQRGDIAARERIERHTREAAVEGELETRDTTTGAFGGLVVPQYLTEEFAPVLRAGRAFANACRSLPLPAEGMSLIVPRGNTGSSTASQATENTAVSETDVDFNSDLTVPVRTIAGKQDTSRQSLERGTPGIDRLLYADLIADYAQTLDTQCLNGSGAAGTHTGVINATGVNAVTYTDATPTAAELHPKVADASQQVATNGILPADLIVMHPRRWAFLLAATDSQGRPLVVPRGYAQNAIGTGGLAFGEGNIVGDMGGVPVLVDANIPTNLGTGVNEDAILVVNAASSILWEEGDGMPRQLRFDNIGPLTVELVVYGYSAFTAERHPARKSVITGTGLVAPTF